MTDQPAIIPDGNSFPDPGEVPVLDWVDKILIDADPLYQRPLDETRVDAILRAFSWRSFGALVVVPQADGRYHVPDGQHRLAAAKRHPKVEHVPAVIVQADDVPAEASVFVEINKNRKNVSSLELFFAQLAAGDPETQTIVHLTQKAGLRIPKYPGDYRPGDTIAVTGVRALLAKHGSESTEQMLTIAASGKFRPIKGEHLKAIEALLTDPEFATVEPADLATLLGTVGNTLENEAKRFAATHCVPLWKGLASTWFQKCRKRRAPSNSANLQNSAAIARAANPHHAEISASSRPEPTAHLQKAGMPPPTEKKLIPYAGKTFR